MIAALLQSGGESLDGAAFARLLDYGAGSASRWLELDGNLLAQSHRKSAGSWSPGRAASGRLVLFNGQFHNRAAVALELGLAGVDGASLYAAALDRWGEEADEHIIGHYCAVALAPDRAGLRLARSPLGAPPLHFRHDGARAIAASLPRPLFWRSSAPRRVDLDRLARSRLIDFTERFAGWYEGCGRVPLGCALTLTPAGFRETWRYDLFSRPCQRLPRDEDYVEAAQALLDEGVAAALAGSRRPGLLLSGGLDSSQVAVSALRQLPPEVELPSFTYGPDPEWTGSPPPGRYASEFPAVARLVAAYPRLKPEFFTHGGQDFRHRLRDLLAVMDCAPPALGSVWIFHDLFERARARGCDVLLWGDWGNLTFSNSAPWAAVEYFRKGRWRQMTQVLGSYPGDARPLWRRFLGRVMLPQLPDALWSRVARWRNPPRSGHRTDVLSHSGLSPDWVDRHQMVDRALSGGLDIERLRITSRREFWQRLMAEDGQEHEQVLQGLEQLYGVSMRDPTAYRPLVEFCYGVPTDQFTRGTTSRFLARRMAAGRLPAELAERREIGAHNSDWPLRIARARDELIAELDRMGGDADIAAMFDLDYLRRTLVEFSVEDPGADAMIFLSALPMAIAGGRFIAYAKGRNDI